MQEVPQDLLLLITPSLSRPQQHLIGAVPSKQHYPLALLHLSVNSTPHLIAAPRHHLYYYSLTADCSSLRPNLSLVVVTDLLVQTIVMSSSLVWINFPPF